MRLYTLVLWVACVQAQALAQGWADHNRSLALVPSQIWQNYREIDTQGRTASSSLDTERGHLYGLALQARWQGPLALGAAGQAQHHLPLWLQAQSAQANGQTDYDGYLQSGNRFTPYQARTGNTLQQSSLRVGVPVSIDAMQLVPYIEWASQRWQRNLVQYGEIYTYRSHSLGLLAQWQIAPQWVLEAGHQESLGHSARLQAPTLGFDAALDMQRLKHSELSLHYVSPPWSLQLLAQYTRHASGESAVMNGLQSPPSTTSQTRMGLGLGWHY